MGIGDWGLGIGDLGFGVGGGGGWPIPQTPQPNAPPLTPIYSLIFFSQNFFLQKKK